MNTPSQDIMSILTAAGIVSSANADDWFVVGDDMPDTPDRAVRVVDSGGPPPVLALGGVVSYDRPRVQIVVRGKREDKRATEAKARQLRDELHGLENEIWSGARYIAIWAQGDIIEMGKDENGRTLYSINLQIWRKPA
jgi:hypothetical protein